MNENNKKHKKRIKLSPLVQSIVNDWETASDDDISDVLGSYTGNPSEDDYPVQDADDL
ncbi:MAG: hypothetical protein MJ168_08890 [Clostridia bacterium]|nr:hypothetical protein [Clostridia bacterium]